MLAQNNDMSEYTCNNKCIVELPEVYEQLAELVGYDNMMIIAKAFGGGESIYFPKIESIERPGRNQKIISEFNGFNYKDLAKKYELTEMRIRSIMKESQK